MPKKKKTTVHTREYVLVPVAWLERLVELAGMEGTNAQHFKGYIASADIMIDQGKRVNEEKYYQI